MIGSAAVLARIRPRPRPDQVVDGHPAQSVACRTSLTNHGFAGAAGVRAVTQQRRRSGPGRVGRAELKARLVSDRRLDDDHSAFGWMGQTLRSSAVEASLTACTGDWRIVVRSSRVLFERKHRMGAIPENRRLAGCGIDGVGREPIALFRDTFLNCEICDPGSVDQTSIGQPHARWRRPPGTRLSLGSCRPHRVPKTANVGCFSSNPADERDTRASRGAVRRTRIEQRPARSLSRRLGRVCPPMRRPVNRGLGPHYDGRVPSAGRIPRIPRPAACDLN
jgi:hypothetical protein